MSFEINFERRRNYLHARVTGTNDRETVFDYMNAIKARCTDEKCFSVLIEENLDGPRFDEMQIYSLISDGGPDALGFFDALAYVDEQQDFEVVKFAETVAVNRGIPIAAFASVADAKNWLRHRSDGDSGLDIFRGDGEEPDDLS
jgi:hypothetical protein